MAFVQGSPASSCPRRIALSAMKASGSASRTRTRRAPSHTADSSPLSIHYLDFRVMRIGAGSERAPLGPVGFGVRISTSPARAIGAPIRRCKMSSKPRLRCRWRVDRDFDEQPRAARAGCSNGRCLLCLTVSVRALEWRAEPASALAHGTESLIFVQATNELRDARAARGGGRSEVAPFAVELCVTAVRV